MHAVFTGRPERPVGGRSDHGRTRSCRSCTRLPACPEGASFRRNASMTRSSPGRCRRAGGRRSSRRRGSASRSAVCRIMAVRAFPGHFGSFLGSSNKTSLRGRVMAMLESAGKKWPPPRRSDRGGAGAVRSHGWTSASSYRLISPAERQPLMTHLCSGRGRSRSPSRWRDQMAVRGRSRSTRTLPRRRSRHGRRACPSRWRRAVGHTVPNIPDHPGGATQRPSARARALQRGVHDGHVRGFHPVTRAGGRRHRRSTVRVALATKNALLR